jgi:hypothetical protein
MVKNPVVGPAKFQALFTVSLSKSNCTAIVLTLKRLSECTIFRTRSYFHRFCEILNDNFSHHLPHSL